MKINLTQKPPSNIFKDRGKYSFLAGISLLIAACGFMLIFYGIYSNSPSGKTLETVSLSLLFGSAILITYFGTEVQAYKKLGPKEQKELADLAAKYPGVENYLKLVQEEGREPIFAEYEACQDLDEDEKLKQDSKNC